MDDLQFPNFELPTINEEEVEVVEQDVDVIVKEITNGIEYIEPDLVVKENPFIKPPQRIKKEKPVPLEKKAKVLSEKQKAHLEKLRIRRVEREEEAKRISHPPIIEVPTKDDLEQKSFAKFVKNYEKFNIIAQKEHTKKQQQKLDEEEKERKLEEKYRAKFEKEQATKVTIKRPSQMVANTSNQDFGLYSNYF
tara:strand:- start:1458 stop:2036 length:579 start_codon:yes stop_codon:yes gene_type:complete